MPLIILLSIQTPNEQLRIISKSSKVAITKRHFNFKLPGSKIRHQVRMNSELDKAHPSSLLTSVK